MADAPASEDAYARLEQLRAEPQGYMLSQMNGEKPPPYKYLAQRGWGWMQPTLVGPNCPIHTPTSTPVAPVYLRSGTMTAVFALAPFVLFAVGWHFRTGWGCSSWARWAP